MVACQRSCYLFNDLQIYPQKKKNVNTLRLLTFMLAKYESCMFPSLVLSHIYSLCLTVCANNQHQDRTHLNLLKPAGAEREKHSTSFSFQSHWTLLPNSPVFNCDGSYNSPPLFHVQGVV